MKKRLISVFLALALALSAFPMLAQARTSDYIDTAKAELVTGSGSGDLILKYNVRAVDAMDMVGVKKVQIYTAAGTLVRVIEGAPSNNLLKMNAMSVNSSYTMHKLTPGASYYCVVTAYAKDASGSETRTITTNTAKAGT